MYNDWTYFVNDLNIPKGGGSNSFSQCIKLKPQRVRVVDSCIEGWWLKEWNIQENAFTIVQCRRRKLVYSIMILVHLPAKEG